MEAISIFNLAFGELGREAPLSLRTFLLGEDSEPNWFCGNEFLPDGACQEVSARACFAGSMAHDLWSSWWWPKCGFVEGPKLWDPDSPHQPQSGPDWAGRCYASSATVFLFGKVSDGQVALPVSQSSVFASGKSIMGLLTLLIDFNKTNVIKSGFAKKGPYKNEPKRGAADFHRMVVSLMGVGESGLGFDDDLGYKVYNHPAGKFEMFCQQDPEHASRTLVRCIWFYGDYSYDPGYAVNTNEYSYWIKGGLFSPTDGGWRNKGSQWYRPDSLWFWNLTGETCRFVPNGLAPGFDGKKGRALIMALAGNQKPANWGES